MPIPSSIIMRRPFLEALKDRKERELQDILELVARHFQLTDEERARMKPTGGSRFLITAQNGLASSLKKLALLRTLPTQCTK